MPENLDDDSHSSRKSSGSPAVMTILIIFGSLAGVALLACCGVGTYGYFMFQRFANQAVITAPVDIQKLTAEMTDIAIPPEFVPLHGSSIPLINMKMATYQWCPNGNCTSRNDGLGTFLLSSIKMDDGAGQNNRNYSDEQYSDDSLKASWKEFTKTEHTFDIRGHKCTFYIVHGEQLIGEEMDEDAMSNADDAPDVVHVTEVDRDRNTVSSRTVIPGQKLVEIHGAFPGKEADVTLQIQLAPEDYDEAKILGMLQSIR